MNEATAALTLSVIALVVLCEGVYLLRQIVKALHYANLESARQSQYLKTLLAHSEISRYYLQHISRRTRAPQEARDDEGDDQIAVHERAVES